MTEKGNAMMRAFDDARALLGSMLSGGWQDIHVVSGGTEIFIARDGGRPNPMRQAAAVALPSVAEIALAPDREVTAPHVATVVDVLTVGTVVEAGERIATIRVLDREETIAAPQSGSVIAIHADVGALVEFKMPIVSLSGVAR